MYSNEVFKTTEPTDNSRHSSSSLQNVVSVKYGKRKRWRFFFQMKQEDHDDDNV